MGTPPPRNERLLLALLCGTMEVSCVIAKATFQADDSGDLGMMAFAVRCDIS